MTASTSHKLSRGVLRLCLLLPTLLLLAAEASAHSGRRLTIEVLDGRLRTQGVNTGPSDGAPATRPYPNAIHDHWGNVESLGIATSSLPGFDISPSASTALLGHRIDLELLGVSKWVSPPLMPGESTVPSLVPLAADQRISILGGAGEIDSDSRGTLLLTDAVGFGGVEDLDLIYTINTEPVDEIHVLRFVMSATPLSGATTQIVSSRPIHVLLSPDGDTPAERLHEASLFLERYVATIPEPSSACLALLVMITRFGTGSRGLGIKITARPVWQGCR